MRSRLSSAAAGCDSLRVGPLLLLGVGFLLREQVGPIVRIGWPLTAEGFRTRHPRHQHERAQPVGQALTDVRAVPALGHVLRRRPAIQGMPGVIQNSIAFLISRQLLANFIAPIAVREEFRYSVFLRLKLTLRAAEGGPRFVLAIISALRPGAQHCAFWLCFPDYGPLTAKTGLRVP